MQKNIIISTLNKLAAILNSGYLHELIIRDSGHQIGNIYIGTISRIFPSIKAVFVTIEINRKHRNGFIHLSDLLMGRRYKFGQLSGIAVFKQRLCVQVIKEAFLSKNCRLTSYITLNGKYIVFVPFNKAIYISRQISSSVQKNYLQSAAVYFKPLVAGGIFFKNTSSKINLQIILDEWTTLHLRWQLILKIINSSLYMPVNLIYLEDNLLKKIARDYCQCNDVQSIYIDSISGLKKISGYIRYWNSFFQLPRVSLVQHKLFDFFNIYEAIAQITSSKVDLLPTGSIFIETFEALTVIDVNSGILSHQKHPASFILVLNCTAAKEIAYQIKVRNITGMIIIDFIDMTSEKDQLELLRYMHKLFKSEKVLTQIVQFSELGLVEITRKRTGKNLQEALSYFYSAFLYRTSLLMSSSKFLFNTASSDNNIIFETQDNLRLCKPASLNLKKQRSKQVSLKKDKLITLSNVKYKVNRTIQVKKFFVKSN